MKLWQSLYAMIWLAFLEILIVLDPIQDIKYSLFIHLFLGIGIVILAIYNEGSPTLKGGVSSLIVVGRC